MTLYDRAKSVMEELVYHALSREGDKEDVPSLITFSDSYVVNKCLFLYPLEFKKPEFFVNAERVHEEQFTYFKELMRITHMLLRGTDVTFRPLTTDDFRTLDTIMMARKKYIKKSYTYLYENMRSTDDIEFISFAYYAVQFLHSAGYKRGDWMKYVPTEGPLRSRFEGYVRDVLSPIDTLSLFKQMPTETTFALFYGRLACGIPNIFKGCVPHDIPVEKLVAYTRSLAEDPMMCKITD